MMNQPLVAPHKPKQQVAPAVIHHSASTGAIVNPFMNPQSFNNSSGAATAAAVDQKLKLSFKR